MAGLDVYLAAKAAEPWQWGVVDCCMALADWGIFNGHADILSRYRGAYQDEAGCQAIIVRRGGLLPIISDGSARVGLLKLSEPERGAIAVIGSRSVPTRQWGAIWDGDRWMVRSKDGFVPVAARELGMWRV